MRCALPAAAARLAAGLSVAEAARRAHVSEGYLLTCERTNNFPMVFARKLARMYACPLDTFLPSARSAKTPRRLIRVARQAPGKPATAPR